MGGEEKGAQAYLAGARLEPSSQNQWPLPTGGGKVGARALGRQGHGCTYIHVCTHSPAHTAWCLLGPKHALSPCGNSEFRCKWRVAWKGFWRRWPLIWVLQKERDFRTHRREWCPGRGDRHKQRLGAVAPVTGTVRA